MIGKPKCSGRWSVDNKRRSEYNECRFEVDHDGECEPREKPKGQSFADAVADAMYAPESWQSKAPDGIYERGQPVGPSADLTRILALPRRPPLDLDSVTAQAIIDLEMAKYARPNDNCRCKEIDPNRECIKRLLPIQAWMLREIAMVQGLLGSVPVGGGKTLVGILAPLALRDCPRPLLLIPASLVSQIADDYRMIREHFRVPGLIIHAGPNSPPSQIVTGEVSLHVLPYSRLSMPESSDWLANFLAPTAIIADEVDSLKDRTSSRTMRLMKYIAGDVEMTPEQKQQRRRTKFCGWTGSLSDKSLMEFAHLSLLALREKSPVPIVRETVEEFGECLDATDNPSPMGELIKFCDPGEDVRRAYRRRLADTLGFITTNSSDVIIEATGEKVELIVREKEAPEIPEIVKIALEMVRKGKRPDTLVGSQYDEELSDAMVQARCAQEVATGVFYRWKFPPINGVPQQQALIDRWYFHRALWNKAVRMQSQKGQTYLDSAQLCEHAAMRAWGDMPERPDRPSWKCEHWPAWRDIKNLVYWEQEAKLLDDYLIKDASEWGLENRGIIWYGMAEFGRLVAQKSGLTLHTGGQGAGDKLKRERGNQSIICSIKSHGRGRNGLQYLYDRQLIINTMASATGFEQLLGRTDRRGQKSNQVITEIYLHTPELLRSFEQAVRRGEYVQDILGQRQKLLKGLDR